MNLNMQSVSRTAEAIEWASVPRENPQKRSFGRRAWACVLLMLIGLVFFTTADAAATYYVSSSSGSDANPGTQSAPWRTLAKVYKSKSLFKPGDNILLKRGDTWYEIFNIAHQAGVSGTPIIYGAYGSGVLPTVDAQKARLFGVYMDNVSHIIVRDLRTINATADGFRIVAATGNVSDIVVQGVVSEKNTRDGFSVEATLGVTHVDALEYHDDVAHLNGRSGFHAFHVSDGATGIHYYGCKATYNGQLGANHGFSGYFANNLHYHEVEAAFTNINPATGLPNSFTGEGIGISFDDYTSNSSVEHSYIHDNARTGVVLAHRGSNNTASYNVIAFNGVYGLVVNGKTGSNNIQILNNTIYGNKGYGIQAWLPINGLAIKNNVLVNNAGYGIGFSATGITNSTVAANLFFGNTLGTMSYVPGATGTIVADPAFTAPASRDFSLQASSPAINKGLYLGGPYQLGLKKGSIWPFNVLLQDQGLSSWDIGSFVYTSGGLTSSTTLLASSANPSLLGAIVTFTATVTGTAPTGSVAFRANGTTLSGCGAIALPAGTANSKTVTCSTAGLSAGVHSIVASYAGNATNNGSTSAPLSQVVNINSKTASTTGLASSANPSLLGASVTFTATVTGRAPTGSVAFKANGTTFSGCGAIALPAGTANSKTVICSTAGLSAATHSIVATYAGDAGNNGSSSAALSQVVNALVNPSFEIPVLPSGSYQSNPSATGIGWTFSGNSGIQRNGSGWGAALAPAGTQTAFINMTGTIRQTLNLTAGSYTLSFQAARRSCCVSPYVQPVKVTMDGTQIGSLVSPTSTSFTAFSIPFSVATSGTHTLTFTGTDPANKTTFIDAVMLRRNSP